MIEQIENFRLKFNCHADWDSMDSIDGAKHCGLCQKTVYDFTNTKQLEFLKILAENSNNICGRFRLEQIAPPDRPALPAWKNWVSAALVLIGINIFNTRAQAQNAKPHIVNRSLSSAAPELVMGMPVPAGQAGFDYKTDPEFPGGYAGFESFLRKNLNYKKGMADGRVIVSFDIGTTGRLSNLQVRKGVSPLNDNEVIRVLKLSPKWKPSMYKGKPTASSYIIPVSFKKK